MLFSTLEPKILSKACSYKKDSSAHFQEVECLNQDDPKTYNLSSNFSPTMYGPVMISKRLINSGCLPEDRVILSMMWGMIPPWHTVCPRYFAIARFLFVKSGLLNLQGIPTKHGLSTNNSRLEGITEKKLFREPLSRGNRCVVLCDGFYEWKSQGKGVKQPYFIYSPQNEGVGYKTLYLYFD